MLEGLPGDRTRLVVGGYARSEPKLLAAIANILFGSPAHWIMQTHQFANLKRCAERRAGSQCLTLDAPDDSLSATAKG